jgi:uncharacterized protein (TIGR03435 family)
MDFLAWRLSQTMDRPVIDQTGLTGGYDFNLAFTDDPPPIRAGNAPVDPLLLDTSGQNVFEALRSQLGLRLEARRTPVDILVIDHAERPTEN